MFLPLFAITRRRLIAVAAGGALALALTPAMAEKAGSGSVSTTELMAPNALPDIVEGDANAPVTIVEYASMTCSHCAAFHRDVYPTLKKNYIDTGKVKFILREFPLDPLATAAFMLAREMGEKRDAMVDLLFAQQKNWAFVDQPLDGLANVLKQAGLGQEKFEAVLKDQDLYKKITDVRARAAEKFGVNSTPTFFVNGEKYTGELSVADLDKIVAAKAPAK
ncbi:DsbA family protein [Methylocystis echinoides]|jgi:protein-disulfide isomerase|uniref:DsbA family protein n=1 Tax=Methylocystis echinoides TaxID=29468 RepID=UPI00342D585E